MTHETDTPMTFVLLTPPALTEPLTHGRHALNPPAHVRYGVPGGERPELILPPDARITTLRVPRGWGWDHVANYSGLTLEELRNLNGRLDALRPGQLVIVGVEKL